MSARLPTDTVRRITLVGTMVGTIVALVVIWYWSKEELSGLSTAAMIAAISGMLTTAITHLVWLRGSLPEAYSVAIIGFPQSGKTTLITSLFDEVWKGRVPRLLFRPLGESTIERLNTDLAMLKKGKALGPTTDQDKFGYTARVRIPRAFGDRWLKVEFGDFPGEDSRVFAEEFGNLLHKTPFFNWAVTADAFVFVIDIAALRQDGEREYVPEVSKAIRMAWQNIVQHHEERADGVSQKAVVLAFTKADLFQASRSKEAADVIESSGFGDRVPPLYELQRKPLDDGIEYLMDHFDDLIKYMDSDCRKFNVVFTSSFGLQEGARLGAAKLLRAVLPS